MADDRQLDAWRRDARALLRAARSGDEAARERATAVLGPRARERFVLADALHVVAREHAATSWPALVATRRRGPIRAALDEALNENGCAEIDVETDLTYPDGAPVVVSVKRRERNVLLQDGGAAVRRAGRPRGWRQAAEHAAERTGMNVSRTTGAVFVPAHLGRDLESLALRLAQASIDVLEAIVELDDPRAAHG
jgi:hypothetical protein